MASALVTFIGLAASTMMLAFGGFFVYRGVRNYLTLQKMAGTPTSKVRSAALGLVELSGSASPAAEQRSHLGGRPCVYSRLTVEKFSRFKKRWVQVHAFERSGRFVLRDKSGSIAVDPAGADYEFAFDSRTLEVFLKQDGRAATSQAEIFESLSKRQAQLSLGPLQDFILAGKDSGYGEIMSTTRIISSLAPVPADSKNQPPGLEPALLLNRYLDSDPDAADGFRLLGCGEVRLTEQVISEGAELYVLGSAEGTEASGSGAGQGGLIMRRGSDGILIISDKSEKTLSASKAARAMLQAAGGLAVVAFSFAVAYQFI